MPQTVLNGVVLRSRFTAGVPVVQVVPDVDDLQEDKPGVKHCVQEELLADNVDSLSHKITLQVSTRLYQ
jgi:hypothetical protein